jgi:signal transduction histidine kinase
VIKTVNFQQPFLTSSGREILLICADPILTRRLITELGSAGGPRKTPLATSLIQAQKLLEDWTPHVILLDESSVKPDESGETLELAAAALTEHAPVVVVAAAQYQEQLAFLISSGAVDLVARIGNFAPVAAGLVLRRSLLAKQAPGDLYAEKNLEGDFGELLRHEVNNPLTGILGNAELLLMHPDILPPNAVARLETIAELAVRLRETIRRLSDCWESRQESSRIA